jgi:hypothetical protein
MAGGEGRMSTFNPDPPSHSLQDLKCCLPCRTIRPDELCDSETGWCDCRGPTNSTSRNEVSCATAARKMSVSRKRAPTGSARGWAVPLSDGIPGLEASVRDPVIVVWGGGSGAHTVSLSIGLDQNGRLCKRTRKKRMSGTGASASESRVPGLSSLHAVKKERTGSVTW